MPLAAAGVGFTVTLGLLFTLWALMCYTALLLLEVYQHVPADMGLGSLAARYLGRYGQWVTGFCMLFLLYALTAAYISGAGELLASSLNQWLDWQLPPAAGVLIFTLLGGAVVCIGTALVDLFNRFLFSAKIVFLVIMLALLMPHNHQVNLLTLPVEQGLALSAIPVIFTSFGFHGSVPSIVSYLRGDIRKLRRVFIIGSFIPLVAYIFWQLATLGSIDAPAFTALLANNAGLNGLLEAIREVVASPHVELAVHLFADLALATSFLGVSLGLFDYLADMFQRKNSVGGRLQSGIITFPAAAGVRPVLSPRFRHGPRLRRGGISRAGADNAGSAGHEESPRASAGYLAGRRRRTDAMAGSAVRDRHRGYSVQHRCRVVARGGIKKGPAGPLFISLSNTAYTFYRCRMGRDRCVRLSLHFLLAAGPPPAADSLSSTGKAPAPPA